MKYNKTKSMVLAAIMLAGVGLEFAGCKKGEGDPGISFRGRKGRLAGEWTVDSYTSESSSMSTYEDSPLVDGQLIERESTSSTTFDGSSMSMTETEVETYDATGTVRSETYEYEATGDEYSELNTTRYNDGTSESVKYDGDYMNTASMKYTFEKDGTFTATTEETTETVATEAGDGYNLVVTETRTSTSTISGTWAFIGGNDNDEFKNKERVSLWYKSYEETSSSSTDYDYTDTEDDFYDYNDQDYSSETESESSETMDDTDADETWELVMLRNDEMEVYREYSYEYSQDATSSYTQDNVTTSSSYSSNNTSMGSMTMMMTQE